jgi:hypothetical protein
MARVGASESREIVTFGYMPGQRLRTKGWELNAGERI